MDSLKPAPTSTPSPGSALPPRASRQGLPVNRCVTLRPPAWGRYSLTDRDLQITDLTCAAAGSHAVFPDTAFVIDMGAQCTRAIALRDGGKVKSFRTNEKCAAGSGGFLERICRYLEVKLEDIGALSLQATDPQPISSVCAVLAESEIINHVSEGRSVPDIIRGCMNRWRHAP